MRRFNAKILLFGEYAILCGAKALVTPFNRFSGGFSNQNPSSEEFKLQTKFYEYLTNIEDELSHFQFDFESFKNDIEAGVSFESNIPQSYGVGSSGALVATIFDRYAQNKDRFDLYTLKTIFSKMESFFHGESSGLDPLCSYTNHSIKVDEGLERVEVDLELKTHQFFLIDTKLFGDTAPLVEIFKKKIEQEDYDKRFQEQLVSCSNVCIEYLLEKNEDKLFENFSKLSALELELFPEMIPDNFKEVWKEGLKTKDFALKLCGSGGGGFLLGMCKSTYDFSSHDMIVISITTHND